MINHNIKQILIIIFLGLYTTGCDKKDPASSSDPIPDGLSISYPGDYIDGILTVEVEGQEDDHEDDDSHLIIGGFQLESEGESSYSYRQLGLVVEGAITINVAETVEFTVHFLDTSGNDLEGEDDHADEEHCEDLMDEASCTVSDDCEWHADEMACEDEAHDDHGMAIEITGLSAGTTSFQIQLMHDGHADYTSLKIAVTVVNPTNSE